jgi:hypothetical protein
MPAVSTVAGVAWQRTGSPGLASSLASARFATALAPGGIALLPGR